MLTRRSMYWVEDSTNKKDNNDIISLNLKFSENGDEYKKRIDDVDHIRSSGKRKIKINTNKLTIDYDRRDQRQIKTLKNVILYYEKPDGKCVELRGNLGCSWVQPFGGEFFLKKIWDNKNQLYSNIRAPEIEVDFSNPLNIIRNDELSLVLEGLINKDNFVYNISQFNEFMEVFKFYKSITSELNNDASFSIDKIFDYYYYLPVEYANHNFNNEVHNKDEVLIGYKLSEREYSLLSNDEKSNVRYIFDIEIEANKQSRTLMRKSDPNNFYVSDTETINESEGDKLKSISITNIIEKEKSLIISCELKEYEENPKYKFLNIYDMGQKIKIQSIDDSLKLINQGVASTAFEMIEYLIGDTDMPNNGWTYNDAKEKYMINLNDSQRNAFLMATDGSPVSLIKGPPGTGKTHVINAIIQYITKELKQKVIVSSQTHIAIDNVLDKLTANYDAIIPNRISNRRNKFSGSELDKTLYKTWASKFYEHTKRASNKKLSENIEGIIDNFKGVEKIKFSEISSNEFMVLGATTTTSAISGRKGYKTLEGYEWLIIDEVSKCPITEILRYMPYVKKIIMVGDDYQLPPLLEFSMEDVKELESFDEEEFNKLKSIYEDSVFSKTLEKAKKNNRLVLLKENYRSRPQILNLYNVFYDNDLIGKRTSDEKNIVELKSNIITNDNDAFFIEVKNGKEAQEGTSRFNMTEIDATKVILKHLLLNIENKKSVSIAAIFPYAAQIKHFQIKCKDLINDLKREFKSFEMDTVDAFQGKEADVVLCNTVIADKTKGNFLNDFRRINVSMSRAREKLIIFGNSGVLSSIEMGTPMGQKRTYFKEIINMIKNNYKSMIIYENGELKNNENTSKSTITFK